MNHLMRDLAPITAAGWEAIEDEAKREFATHLTARRLVDWSGPHGWAHAGTNLGRKHTLSGIEHRNEHGGQHGDSGGDSGVGVVLRQRSVLPLVELRVSFTVARAELDDAERGAQDLDFDVLDAAAARVACTENRAIVHGWQDAGLVGMTRASAHQQVRLGDTPEEYPGTVAAAVETLRAAGARGPYAMVVSPAEHTRIVSTTEHGGYLLADHLRRVLGGGKLVRAPGVDGAVVFSLAGGDFVFDVGQDVSIGYTDHDSDSVALYFEESFTFHVNEPTAAITLA